MLPSSSLPWNATTARSRDACEERDYKGLHVFPSNTTRNDPPITRDCPPSLLTLEGRSLTALVPAPPGMVVLTPLQGPSCSPKLNMTACGEPPIGQTSAKMICPRSTPASPHASAALAPQSAAAVCTYYMHGRVPCSRPKPAAESAHHTCQLASRPSSKAWGLATLFMLKGGQVRAVRAGALRRSGRGGLYPRASNNKKVPQSAAAVCTTYYMSCAAGGLALT